VARTTSAAVAGILLSDLNSADVLTPFIEAANDLVTNVCVPLTYTATTLELIERWLAAHFYCIAKPQLEFEKVSEAVEKPQAKIDLHLNQTRYGQQAMSLDYKGGLANLNAGMGKVRMGAFWLGTDLSEDDEE